MRYKPDFDEMIPRMEAWWQGEILDRCCIAVSAPNGKAAREVAAPATLYERWTDHDYVLDAAEARMETAYFAGERVPVFRPNLGPDLFAALLGGTIEYREDTSWVAPFLGWDDPPAFEIDTGSFEWKWHEELYPKAAERAEGAYLLGAPDCHSGGDCLLAMRGGTDLCLDIYDRPEQLLATMAKLEAAVEQFHAAWWPLMEARGQRGHATSWLTTWSPGRSNATQLDLLALISPQQFEEFFFHELEVQCDVLDNTIFHLDGPDAIKQLPKLYELENVGAIQWVYGAGNGPMTKWIDLLKEIQSHGKGLHLSCEAGEVETLVRELSSKGLYLSTWAEDAAEADALVKLAAELTHD